jgi:FtsP/CotA-like multicopper oxidase with cupredoxin domain
MAKHDHPNGGGTSRRDFLGLALAAGSSAALWPVFSFAQQSGVVCVPRPGQPLASLGEIRTGADKVLRGIIDLTVDTRQLSYYNANGGWLCVRPTLRTYSGYQGYEYKTANRVTPLGVTAPGPTLRVPVGGTVQLIFLNRINRDLFNKTSVTSVAGDCDQSTSLTGRGTYPGKDAGRFPNCFHASNTTNLHFHGTHTTPNGFGDNVLIGVLPAPNQDPAAAIAESLRSYEEWQSGKNPSKWLIENMMKQLQAMLDAAKKAGNAELATQLESAIHGNHENLASGEFPQYWPGYFPHFFQLPEWSGSLEKYPRMGQAPGTHWYHCHQHGSTTLQLLNGMAGLLLITGDYDAKLLALGYKEQVMIFQIFAEQVNLITRGGAGAFQLAVNGQVNPKVTMKKNEVQWWRIANASMKSHGTSDFLFLDAKTYKYLIDNPQVMTVQSGPNAGDSAPPPPVDPTLVPSLSQTAQDGVQFDWVNFQRFANKTSTQQAPGNRGDFLVKAPNVNGPVYLVYWPPGGGPPPIADIRANTVLTVDVVDGTGVPTALPTEKQYPEQPKFLGDITDAEIHGRANRVDFSMSPGGPGSQPFFYIDGEQFNEGTLDQVMLLNTAEEWTLTNSSTGGIMHPFHIHINPFQVTEIFDPLTMKEPLQLPAPWVWWDTFPIPAGVQKVANGKFQFDPVTNLPVLEGPPGHIKIRTRFVDYPGTYVLHCHILGHEDRGMMQLVKVMDNKTVVKHH